MQFFCLIFALITQSALADTAVESGAEVSATVRLGTSNCLKSPADCPWMDFRDTAIFSPWIRAKTTPLVRAVAAIDVRIHGPSTSHGMDSQTEPLVWSLRAKDISVSTRGPHTHFKLGAYRTAWGVADGISIVDTINPLDLEDPTRFDRRLSIPTASLTATTGNLLFSGLIAPFFVPAALPDLYTNLMLTPGELVNQQLTGGTNASIGALQSRPTVPANSLANATVGGQLRWNPGIADMALSWHRGRDSLPQVAGDVLMVGYQTNTDQIDVGLPLIYPRLDTIGFTTRMLVLAPMIAWLEVAHIVPEATSASASEAQLDALVKLGTLSEMPNPIPTTITQDGKPFTRWIVGASLPISQLHLTAQWLRGFFTERRKSNLQDYALLGMQWSVSETVRLDGRTSLNSDGHLMSVSIEYLHDDTVEVALGVQQIDGKKGSTFAGFQQASNVYSRVSMQF